MDKEVMLRYDAEIANGGTADSVILRTVNVLVAAERERAARVCDDEARILTEAGSKHGAGTPAFDRCMAAARAARNCALGVRGGEVVGITAELTGAPPQYQSSTPAEGADHAAR